MKTKLQISILFLIIIFSSNFNIMAQDYSGGSGTVEDPYKINDQNDLYYLAGYPGEWGKHFIQTADIDLSSISGNFGVIGNGTTSFTGSYNGQDFTINGLTNLYTGQDDDYIGLFGKIYEATIKNLHLTNVQISGNQLVGGLVGSAGLSSLIEDCSATGSVEGVGTDSEDIGGLVGSSISDIKNSYSECTVTFNGGYAIGGFIGRNSGTITNCYSTGSVSDGSSSGTYSYWGGFVGNNSGTISTCFATGDVAASGTSSSYAGGFVGYNQNGDIELCYATGTVSNASSVGGFAGYVLESSWGTSVIARSYSSGDVSSSLNVGGFIGRLYDAKLTDCYSLGDVTKTTAGGSSYAGFCGDIVNGAIIEHSYSTGAVYYTPGTDPADKGFVGTESSLTGSYDANFFNTTTSNQTTATGATGKSHDNMNDGQTFTVVSSPDTPWDIVGVQGAGSNDYWEMVSGINSGYPFIRATYSTPTNTPTSITENSATCGGNVFDSGSNAISERGVCWSTSQNPTTADSKTSDGTTTGAFTSSITGLSASTTYYVRAYVTNNVGTSYGDEETFTTTAATPVELTSFTAKVIGKSVVLNWQTATEVNNYGFHIERKSGIENREWKEIGFIEGHGNSNSPKEYSFVDTDIPVAERSRSYRLKQIDFDGAFEYHDVVTVELNGTMEYKLAQNHPNPFNPSTQIAFTIPSSGVVKLNVYNVLGEVVTELVNQNLEAGTHQYEFDASNLTSGIYFYSISVNGFTEVKKMNLVK